MAIKIKDIKNLIKQYEGETTLNDLLKKIQKNKIHKCPKCKGEGENIVKYNAYPKGLPDSRWVEDWKYKNVECDLCNGEGYTEKEYKPRMIQQGWETV
ncbi:MULTISPECIES: hypothetical protein [unclassified Clostridium]|uniref:hypothetical protein n=1 Tax=unclassified Clostridium TaxID=2614128 RepID=UPI0025C007AB|nr:MULTISPECIES: hypothetical protein [unclassified Clostridium]